MVTAVLVSLVTVLPAASWMVTTGCVVKATPEAPSAGAVVKDSCVAVPGPETWVLPEVAEDKLEPVKLNV
jgi:hypothetical protein